jgi:hypothetical protein
MTPSRQGKESLPKNITPTMNARPLRLFISSETCDLHRVGGTNRKQEHAVGIFDKFFLPQPNISLHSNLMNEINDQCNKVIIEYIQSYSFLVGKREKTN